jgi:hypothetical protein
MTAYDNAASALPPPSANVTVTPHVMGRGGKPIQLIARLLFAPRASLEELASREAIICGPEGAAWLAEQEEATEKELRRLAAARVSGLFLIQH